MILKTLKYGIIFLSLTYTNKGRKKNQYKKSHQNLDLEIIHRELQCINHLQY
jgi:hypothetical protein